MIVADSQDIFRAGIATVLTKDKCFRIIAQCADVEGMMHAITRFPGAIVLLASLRRPDWDRLHLLLEEAGSRAIVIAEDDESAGAYMRQGFRRVVFRSVTATALAECVRRVDRGNAWVPQLAMVGLQDVDEVGTRVRDRLSSKGIRIVALLVQGCTNGEIANRLKTTEQVIKNYLRFIYDKTGVSTRLELALFTVHHRVLARAVEEMGSKLEAEEQQSAQSAVA